MMKAKINLKNIFAYIQGNIRYKIYYKYKFLKFLVPKYIWEQIEIRINSMDKECYNNGACKICGCSTTALQFANKSCDKPCYPNMMSKGNFYKNRYSKNKLYFDEQNNTLWKIENDKFIKI